MTERTHAYAVAVEWVGNRGSGTTDYRAYDRTHRISADHKTDIVGSADPAFRGDANLWNPEEMLVGALSACHKLWYLHLCADAGIVVVAYRDEAIGEMQENSAGGRFVRVVLRPRVAIADPVHLEQAERLHAHASSHCFIRNSVNFPVTHEPRIAVSPDGVLGDRTG